MRAAAILGLGCSPKDVRAFQTDATVEWRIGLPATTDEADVILIIGGDGTIHRHLEHLVRLGLPVLVVPSGSGNDFARSIGLHRAKDSVAAWLRFVRGTARIHEIDLGCICPLVQAGAPSTAAPVRSASHDSTYFCSVAGMGRDSEVAGRANRLPRWLRGNGGYVLSLIPAVFTFEPLRVKILTGANDTSSDRWSIRSDRPTLLAAFANTTTYGGGMMIAPLAKMDDGFLDVCAVGAVSPFKLFTVFPTVYKGRHLKIKEVEYFQTPRVRVETERPLDVYADGEYVCRTPVEVSIKHGALKVITAGSRREPADSRFLLSRFARASE